MVGLVGGGYDYGDSENERYVVRATNGRHGATAPDGGGSGTGGIIVIAW
ncbi:hypothetical protein [Streptomyces sp. NPDC089915]